MPFAPTWWSFTFPVGTVVTGTSALAAATGLDLFTVAAGIMMVGLLAGWITAALGTASKLRWQPEPTVASASSAHLDAPATFADSSSR